MQHKIAFQSAGVPMAGILDVPEEASAGPHPAFILLHGFGSSKDASNMAVPALLLAQLGYVVLRFDRRGCGESGGEPGLNLCPEHVEDACNALAWLQTRPEVDAQRIAVLGTSFGGAIAMYAAGVDQRFAAAISVCGWGDGARKLRGQHPGEEAWSRFLGLLEQGRGHRERNGRPMMISRFDIVPIPAHLRGGLAANARMEFPVETAQSIYDFRPEDVIPAIAPRPVLFLHAAPDSVTPTSESLQMFQCARPPAELHLFHGVDHFMLGEGNPRVTELLRGWLAAHFPAPGAAAR
jgi:pimeloyl-ACP methyl ester carboxylesterase